MLHNELSIIVLAIYLAIKFDRLLLVALISCVSLQIAFISNMDIALYYGVCGVISIASAIYSPKTLRGRVYIVFMMIQSLLCLVLIPDWSFTANETMQYNLNRFNDIMLIIIISLCISGRDNDASASLDNR